MRIFLKYFFLFYFLFQVFLSAQVMNDSIKTDFKLNSLKTDWNLLTSPVSFYPSNYIQQFNPEINSLYTMFTNSQVNSGLNIVNSNIMLNQFQLANGWETQKKYGVFAKYLGIAQFMGAVGLAAIHISKFHAPPKGKINRKKPQKLNIERP